MGIAPLPKEQGSGVGKTARIRELFRLEKLSESHCSPCMAKCPQVPHP